MELLVLEAKIRDKSVSAKILRRENMIPAVCYGRGFENRTLEVGYQAFRKVFRETGSSQVFNLDINGEKVPVLVHEVGYNPVTDKFDHIDFLQIDMKKVVTAMVPVEVEGVSPAVKNFNAIVTVVKHEIEVKCLPMDIPHEIKVDISKLENPGDAVHISDLNLGNKVEILDDPETTLVSVSVVEEFKEAVVEVPEDLKAEPVAAAEGGEAAAEGKEPAAEEKKE